jgi:hypothetical protein
MAVKRITPDLRGVKLVPDARYMINKKSAGKHGATIYPYDEVMMEKNPNLVEFFPKFKEVEPEAQAVVEPEAIGGDVVEPVEIEEVTIEIPKVPAPEAKAPVPELKPWQKAQLAKAQKAAAQTQEG